MNLKKIMSKVAAVGAGATMVGATLMGALATSLADYPSPFVSDGAFDAVLVVGDNAAAADIIGVTDIAMALQFSMKTTTNIEGESSQSGMSEGAELTKAGNVVVLAETVGSSEAKLDGDEFEALLADGVLEDEDNDEYDYKQYIHLSTNAATIVEYGTTDDSDYDDFAVIHLDTGGSSAGATTDYLYKTEVSFDRFDTNLTTGEEITMFGSTYSLSSNLADLNNDKLTFHGATDKTTLSVGQSATLGGVTIEVVGANAENDEATIKVDGDSEQVEAGDTVKSGDVEVFIEDIFLQTIPVDAAQVEFSVSSGDIVLEDTKRVKIGGEWVDGTYVAVTTDTTSYFSGFTISVFPSDFDDEVYYLEEGDEIVDPVFGTFKFTFADVVNGPDDNTGRDTLSWTEGDSDSGNSQGWIELTFTNKAGDTYDDMEMWFINSTGNVSGLTNSDSDIDIHVSQEVGVNLSIGDDDWFIVNVGSDPTYTHILSFDDYDAQGEDDDDLTITDLATGEDVSKWSSNLTATLKLEEDVTITFVTTGVITDVNDSDGTVMSDWIYTKGNLKFNISAGFNITAGRNDAWNVTEDGEGANWDDDAYFVVSADFDSSDNVANLRLQNDNSNDDVDDSRLTVSGTYILEDDEDGDYTYVTATTPADEMWFSLWMSPTDAATTSTTSGGLTTDVITQIEVGSTKLASEAGDVTAMNAIVVGGPCANAAASVLMGNPSPCYAGFTEGEAMVKLYENGGNTALLVAGATADDTRTAAKLVANGGITSVDGMEAVITTLTESVTAPVAATTEAEAEAEAEAEE